MRSHLDSFRLAVLCLLACAALAAVTGCTRRKEIWIYTSLPKEVIAEMVEPLQASVPGADVKWFQSASENLANRLSAEMESGKFKADLVVSSDPFWYVEAKTKGKLMAYDSPAAKEVPAAYRDPEHAYVAVRLPVMVMAYNSSILKPAELPERWKDLEGARFDRKVSMSSPLDLAPTFAVLAHLSKLFGWEYFAGLRKHGLVAEGAHTAVLTRIETGERPIGVLPLDVILRASVHNKSLKPIYPLDGSIPVPGPIAILKDTDHPEIARGVYDWFFSASAQGSIVRGGSYSALPKFASPEGARPWAELQNQLIAWTPESLSEMYGGRDRIRAKFSEVVLH